jgi:hypothetical protein
MTDDIDATRRPIVTRSSSARGWRTGIVPGRRAAAVDPATVLHAD